MSNSDKGIYAFKGFRLESRERQFSYEGTPIRLSEKAFDTLLAFVTRPGRLLSKEELMEAIWPNSFVEENNLDKNVSILRKTFNQFGPDEIFIETVRGHGYRFLPKVTELVEGADADVRGSPQPKNEEPMTLPSAAIAAVVLIVLAGITAKLIFSGDAPPSGPSAETQTIAILPLRPLTTLDRNEAIELGVTEALIDRLNAGEALWALPLSSVRRFANEDQDAVSAGRELGADSVLEGTVQTTAGRIRISVRLYRVADGKQMWAEVFDESFTDIFAVQDRIATRVAQKMKVNLGVHRPAYLTDDVEAYDLYLKARYLSQKASMPDIEKAISYLERVIELDAEYAPAYVVLADCYRARVLLGDEAPSRAMPKAKAAAEKAVALNGSLAEAHAVLGWIRFWYEHDWQGAEAEFRKALSLELNNSDTHQYYAHLLSNTGRHEEAFEHIDAALKLEPLNLRANAFKAMFLQNAGNLNEAEQQFRSTLELEPDFRLAQMFLARTLGELERYEEALQLVNRIRERNPNAAEPISLDAFLLAKAGKRSEAQKILDELLDNASRRYISSYGIAQVQAALGDRPAALNSLERARLTNDLKLVFLKVDRSWDDLRSEPRFRDLLREIGLDR